MQQDNQNDIQQV